MRTVRTFAQVHSRLLNIAAVAVSLVVTAVLAVGWPAPMRALESEGASIALGALSLASVITGFVGVVVVFGLQASAPVFVRFRTTAGDALGRDWLTLVSTGFLSCAAAMASALAYAVGQWTPGFGLLVLSMLFMSHCAVRMMWLLRILIDAVSIGDRESLKNDQPKLTRAADRYTRAI